MASPQVENGYTRLANELLEALYSIRIGGQEMRVVLYVMRKTYGYRKKSDQISYGQIAKALDISRPRAIEHVKALCEKNILASSNNGTRKPLTLWIQKDYSAWQGSPKKGTSPNNDTRTSPNNGNKPSPNNGTHKRKKEKKKTGKSRNDFPAELVEVSERFLDYQAKQFPKAAKKTEAKVTGGAEALDKLIRLDGYDLEQDIKPVLKFALKDEFWSRNLLSLGSLRQKGKNGELKFVNIFTRMGGDAGPEEAGDMPEARTLTDEELEENRRRVAEKMRQCAAV